MHALPKGFRPRGAPGKATSRSRFHRHAAIGTRRSLAGSLRKVSMLRSTKRTFVNTVVLGTGFFHSCQVESFSKSPDVVRIYRVANAFKVVSHRPYGRFHHRRRPDKRQERAHHCQYLSAFKNSVGPKTFRILHSNLLFETVITSHRGWVERVHLDDAWQVLPLLQKRVGQSVSKLLREATSQRMSR